MILFLDSNILIYLIEGDELLVAQVQQTIQRYRAAHSEIVIAVSALTLLECRVLLFCLSWKWRNAPFELAS